MQYLVVNEGGADVGPVSVDELNTWIADGKINPYSRVIEVGTSKKLALLNVPGVIKPPSDGPNFSFRDYLYPTDPSRIGTKAVIAILFGFFPLGIAAVVYAGRIRSLESSGDLQAAKDAGKISNILANWAFGVGWGGLTVVGVVMYLVIGLHPPR